MTPLQDVLVETAPPSGSKASKTAPPRNRVRVWAKRLFIAWVVYSLFGFFVLPAVIKWQLLKQLPAITKRQAAVEQVKFNPWALSLSIRGLSLTEPDGRKFLSWDEFYVNFQSSSLFRRAWTFKEIRLVKPFGEIILAKDGKLNFANMFESTNAPAARPPAETKSAGGIPGLNIEHLLITNGLVAFEDRAHRSTFRTEYRPINLNLTGFTTRPNEDAPYAFHAESDSGRSISWNGNLTIQPLRSSGDLEITGIRLPRYQPYYDNFMHADVTDGVVDLRLSYHLATDTNGLDLTVTNASASIEKLNLVDPKNNESVVAMKGLHVDGAALDYRSRMASLGKVTISEVGILARLHANGHLNLLDLLTLENPSPKSATTTAAPSPTPQTNIVPAGKPWTLKLDDFALEQTSVTFENLQLHTPFRTVIKPISIGLKHFSTAPETQASYTFKLESESAETFDGAGSLCINPVSSTGQLNLSALSVKKYLPFFETVFRGRILSGQVQMQAPYRFALATNGIQAGVSNLSVKLTDLELRLPESEETLTHVKEFAFERVNASLEDRRVEVGRLSADGGAVMVRLDKDGTLTYSGILASNRAVQTTVETNTAPSANSTPQPDWRVRLEELSLKDYTIHFEDRHLESCLRCELSEVAVDMKRASTDASQPIATSLDCRFNQTGRISVDGSIVRAPFSCELDIGLTNIELQAFQPLLDPYLRLAIAGGAFGCQTRFLCQTAEKSPTELKVSGEAWLDHFATKDTVDMKDFISWDQLSFKGIDFSLNPNQLKFEKIDWAGLKASPRVGTNHQFNVTQILPPHETASNTTTAAAPATAASEAFPIQIGAFTLARAAFSFTDESVEPHATIGIGDLSGSVQNISSAMNTTATVDLSGKLNQQSPFSLNGRINPLSQNLFLDLTFSNANTQLTPLTAYMEKYAGYPLNKGRLSTTLSYHIKGKELKAENKVRIDQLSLGAHNDSPDATKLPVKLGIALLKDSHGRIELDLPVSGRLDDPEFKLAPLILKVVMNLLAKTVASPFKLLGALVGGGEEMSFVSFQPGGTNLVDGEIAKLDKLSKALAQRPALNLEITGRIDPDLDQEALGRQKLQEEIRTQRLQELQAKGKAPDPSVPFTGEPDQYERLLRGAFAARFGTNISAILSTNLAAAGTNSTTRKTVTQRRPRLYQRALALIGLGKYGHRSPAEKNLNSADRKALAQLTPALMETLLARSTPITPDEYGALMESRAKWVQSWLMENGKIEPDRLLLVAPKPVDNAYKGESRAELSLD